MGDNSEIFVGKCLIWRVGDPEIFPYHTSRKGDGTRKHGILIIIFVCLSKLKFYFHDRVFPFPLYGCVYILFYIFSFIFCDFVRLFTSFITTFQFSSTVSGRLFIEKLALKLTDL